MLLQTVVFKVDYVVESIGNREFGSVFLDGPQPAKNVAEAILAAGMAKVRAFCEPVQARAQATTPTGCTSTMRRGCLW